MSVKVEKTDNKNQVKLEFTIEAKVFEEGMKKVFAKNAKYFSIPGFRKGKAPMNIVEKKYGAEIFYEDTFNEIVPDIYDKAIEDEKLEIVSKPNIDIKQMEKGKDLIFTAVVDLKPDVKLGKYKGITVDKTIYKVTDSDIDKELNLAAERNSRMITVEGKPAENGNTVTIDYVGTIDGVEFNGGSANNYDLTLGSNTFIPGFEDQVVGMKVDEVKDIKVKFPDEYPSKEVAGKEANFNVTLHEIKKKELPKIDDDFAKDVSEFDTLKEYKADIKTKLEEKNNLRTKQELEENLVKALSEASEVDITEGMIDVEVDAMVQDMDRNLSYQGMSLDLYLKYMGQTMADYRKSCHDRAKEAIKYRLVLEATAKDAKIEVTEKEIEDKLQELADTYGRKVDELKNNEALKENITESLKSEKVIELLVKEAKVNEVEEKVEKEEKKTTKKADKEEKTEKVEKTTKKSTKKSDK